MATELPFYRPNVTDKEQVDLETAVHEDGIAVFQDATTRVIGRGRQGGAQRTMNAGTDLAKNNGVIMNNDDKPSYDLSKLVGRA